MRWYVVCCPVPPLHSDIEFLTDNILFLLHLNWCSVRQWRFSRTGVTCGQSSRIGGVPSGQGDGVWHHASRRRRSTDATQSNVFQSQATCRAVRTSALNSIRSQLIPPSLSLYLHLTSPFSVSVSVWVSSTLSRMWVHIFFFIRIPDWEHFTLFIFPFHLPLLTI